MCNCICYSDTILSHIALFLHSFLFILFTHIHILLYTIITHKSTIFFQKITLIFSKEKEQTRIDKGFALFALRAACKPMCKIILGLCAASRTSGFAVAAKRQSLTLNLLYFTNIRLYFCRGRGRRGSVQTCAPDRPRTASWTPHQERAGKRRGSVQTRRPRPDANTKTFFDLLEQK